MNDFTSFVVFAPVGVSSCPPASWLSWPQPLPSADVAAPVLSQREVSSSSLGSQVLLEVKPKNRNRTNYNQVFTVVPAPGHSAE